MKEFITTIAILTEIPHDRLLETLLWCHSLYKEPVLEVTFQGQTATVTVSKHSSPAEIP